MQIVLDDLKSAVVQALLHDHLDSAYKNSPPDSVYALDITELKNPDICFWTIWEGDTLLGCGALKELSSSHGEIKSMRTAKIALKRGVGSKVLRHIIEKAKIRGYKKLSLETGSNEPYAPARALYSKFGFQDCGPFADYKEGSFSRFMRLKL